MLNYPLKVSANIMLGRTRRHNMGKEDSSQSFAGRVGIVLMVATLVITGINGIPAFLALHGKEPYIAYEIGRSQMLYPLKGSNL